MKIIGGQYGTDIGDIYDCDNGDLVAIYDFDENGGASTAGRSVPSDITETPENSQKR